MAFPRIFRRRRLAPAALHRCPLCEGDLSRQAFDLLAAGYYLAAVATARANLESRIAAIAQEHQQSTGKAYRLGGPVVVRAMALHGKGLLTKRQLQRVEKLAQRAGKMLHRAEGVNCLRARWVVDEAARLVDSLHANLAKGGAA